MNNINVRLSNKVMLLTSDLTVVCASHATAVFLCLNYAALTSSGVVTGSLATGFGNKSWNNRQGSNPN